MIISDSNGEVIRSVEYIYDVNNNRIGKSVNDEVSVEVERYVLDGSHIALVFDGEGNLSERYLHGNQVDQVIVKENNQGEVNWYLTDNQGSVKVVLDGNGEIINELVYDSFGQITSETNPNFD